MVSGPKRSSLDHVGIGADRISIGHVYDRDPLPAADGHQLHAGAHPASRPHVQEYCVPPGPEHHRRDRRTRPHLLDGLEGGLPHGLAEQHLVAGIHRGRTSTCHQRAVDGITRQPIEQPHRQHYLSVSAFAAVEYAGRAHLAGNQEHDLQFGRQSHQLNTAQRRREPELAHLDGDVCLWKDVQKQPVAQFHRNSVAGLIPECLWAKAAQVLERYHRYRLGRRRSSHYLCLGRKRGNAGQPRRANEREG